MDRDKKTAKFGGSSVANTEKAQQSCAIIESDLSIRYVVVSAPEGMTNTFLALRGNGNTGKTFDENISAINVCYRGLVSGLNVGFDLTQDLSEIRRLALPAIGQIPRNDLLVSRGEYLCAKIIAASLGFEFLDAALFMRFDEQGNYDTLASERAWNELKLSDDKGYVIPGFYGALPSGEIKLFPRNASDFTAAEVARFSHVTSVFEKWTDVPGFFRADPRIVPDAEKIDELTYKELRELTDMGSKLLYPEVVRSLRHANISISVRGVNHPDDPGTRIVPDGTAKLKPPGTVVGISHRVDCILVDVEKFMMGIGYAAQVLGVFAAMGIDIGHIADGTDIISIAVTADQLKGERLSTLRAELKRVCEAEQVNFTHGVAVIRIVGHWMNGAIGTAAAAFVALRDAGVNTRIMSQPSNEIAITICVDERDVSKGVTALYDTFVRK